MSDDLDHQLSLNRVRNQVINAVPYGESKMNTDMMCEDHCEKFAGKPHPDANHKPKHVPDHKRGAGHPAHHSRGKMPSQLQPDHGPHK